MNPHLEAPVQPPRLRPRPAAIALGLACWAAAGPGWARPSPGLASKLAPSLMVAAAADDTLSIWVSFADKGERGPADLAARLAAAQTALAPRARARRLRARVHPLVDYRDLPVHAPYVEGLAARGLAPYGASRWRNGAAVRVSGRGLEALAALAFVSRLSPVERMRRSVEPGPPVAIAERPPRVLSASAVDYGLTAAQLTQINVPGLHDSGYIGAGVLVCVLDEGFNYFDKHEALRDHVIPAERQRDFHRGVASAQDTTDGTLVHGTWVLGCIAGRAFGTYVGAAYGAEFALGRTEVRISETPQEMVYWGMGAEWADSLGADIISSSLGYFAFDDSDDSYSYADMDGHTTIVSQAAQIAASKGILVVNAAGNEGDKPWHYIVAPADVHGDSLLAVGAVDAAGLPAGFSSYGPSADGRVKPDLAARGVSNPIVATTGSPDAYGTLSGTSFATPLVAGLAACLMQARPQWTPREVSRALRSAASRALDPDDRVGHGIPDGVAALAGSRPAPPPRATLGLLGPNPVHFGRDLARFSAALPAGACGRPATLRVHDPQGRLVRELWSGVVSCGLSLPIAWDGTDDQGRACPPGLYLLDLRGQGARASLRLIALR